MPTITLSSNDGEDVVVDIKAAKCSTLIRTMLEDLGEEDGETIPIQVVDGKTLKILMAWANHHMDDLPIDPNEPVEISEWDERFMRDWDQGTLFNVVKAANYMDMRPLLEMTCKNVAGKFAGQSAPGLREIFGIEQGERQGYAIMLGSPDVNTPHVKVETTDGTLYSVDLETAKAIPKIDSLMKEKSFVEGQQKIIKLPKVFSFSFENLVEWVQHHKNDVPHPVLADAQVSGAREKDTSNPTNDWDEEFMNELDTGILAKLFCVAFDMEVNTLANILGNKIAKTLAPKSPEELQALYFEYNLSYPEMTHINDVLSMVYKQGFYQK